MCQRGVRPNGTAHFQIGATHLRDLAGPHCRSELHLDHPPDLSRDERTHRIDHFLRNGADWLGFPRGGASSLQTGQGTKPLVQLDWHQFLGNGPFEEPANPADVNVDGRTCQTGLDHFVADSPQHLRAKLAGEHFAAQANQRACRLHNAIHLLVGSPFLR